MLMQPLQLIGLDSMFLHLWNGNACGRQRNESQSEGNTHEGEWQARPT